MTDNSKYRARKKGEGINALKFEQELIPRIQQRLDLIVEVEDAIKKQKIERIEIVLLPACRALGDGAFFLTKKMEKFLHDDYSA